MAKEETIAVRFSGYDDPNRAEKIYNEYAMSISAAGGALDMRSAIAESRTADELETRLHLIETDLKMRRAGVITTNLPLDPDSGGYQANAIRFLEELR